MGSDADFSGLHGSLIHPQDGGLLHDQSLALSCDNT